MAPLGCWGVLERRDASWRCTAGRYTACLGREGDAERRRAGMPREEGSDEEPGVVSHTDLSVFYGWEVRYRCLRIVFGYPYV